MRLIDADTFKMEDFRRCLDCDSILQVIKYAPTVDAVAVVRCKDCVHSYFSDGKYWASYWCNCHLGVRLVEPDGFCSHGRIKDD